VVVEGEVDAAIPAGDRRRCQFHPWRTTLIRRGRIGPWSPAGTGGQWTRAGGRPCGSASSKRVPEASTPCVATASTSPCRVTREGSGRWACGHCQPTPLSTRKPNAIHPRKPFEQTPTRVGGESGQHHPRLLLRRVPHHHPSALPLLAAGTKGYPAADLGLAGPWNQLVRRAPRLPQGLKADCVMPPPH
jgi:hypothetical protein